MVYFHCSVFTVSSDVAKWPKLKTNINHTRKRCSPVDIYGMKNPKCRAESFPHGEKIYYYMEAVYF
jgi:hypothetical protein